VRELVRYILENAYIDFQGDLSMEKVREFLRDDETREARSLLAKLIDDKGVNELLITVADCLKDHIRSGINEETIREQLSTYSES
jgi:ribulose bisphosphate carboxylase small subunit